MTIKLDLDSKGSDPKALEALQQLLRLAAAENVGGATRDLELSAVATELLAAFEAGDPAPIAWFIWMAGRITGILGQSYVVSGQFSDSLTTDEALRVLEKILERDLKGQPSD